MAAAVAVTALTAAACSSSATKSGSGGGSSQPAGGSKTVAISVRGGHLTAPDGKTLYYNTVDTAKSIKCVTDECVGEWPPLTGTPKVGAGLDADDFATATRPDGAVQVTFYGHPLYEFKDDSAGSMNGNGMSDEGGRWVAATPEQAKGGSSSAPHDSMTSSSGGSGY
jgi:predicted lipoprotein with Yx(FWY)xxD motif